MRGLARGKAGLGKPGLGGKEGEFFEHPACQLKSCGVYSFLCSGECLTSFSRELQFHSSQRRWINAERNAPGGFPANIAGYGPCKMAVLSRS